MFQEPPLITAISVITPALDITLHKKSLVGPFRSGVDVSVLVQLLLLSQTAITTPTLEASAPLPTSTR